MAADCAGLRRVTLLPLLLASLGPAPGTLGAAAAKLSTIEAGSCVTAEACTFSVARGENAYRFELASLCGTGDHEVEDAQRNATLRFRVCGETGSRCAPPWRPNAAHGNFIEYWGQEPAAGTTCYSGAQETTNCTRPCAVAGSHPPQTSALVDDVENVIGIRLVYQAPPPQTEDHACGTDPATGDAKQRSVALELFCDQRAVGLIDAAFVSDSSDACRSTIRAKSRRACPTMTRCAHPGGRAVQCAAEGAACTTDLSSSFADGITVTMHVCEKGLRCDQARAVCVPDPAEDQVAEAFVRHYAQPCNAGDEEPCGAAARQSRLTEAISCRGQARRGNATVCSFTEASRLTGQPCTFDDECATRSCGGDGMCGVGASPPGAPCGPVFDTCVPSTTCDAGTGQCRNNTYRANEDPPSAECGGGRVCADGYTCLGGRCFVAEGAACQYDEECGVPRFCQSGAGGDGVCAPRAGMGDACDATTLPCVQDNAYCGGDGTCAPLPGAGSACRNGLCYQHSPSPSPENAFCGRATGEEGQCYLLGGVPNGRVVNALAAYACASGAGCQVQEGESDLQCVAPHPGTVPSGSGSPPPCGFEPKCLLSGASSGITPGHSHALVPDAQFLQATGKDWDSVLDARNACLGPSVSSNEEALRCLLSRFGPAGVCEALSPGQGTGYRPSDLRLLGVPECAVDTMVRGGLAHAQPDEAMRKEERQHCEAAVQTVCAYTYPSGFRYECGPGSGSPAEGGTPAWVIALAAVAGVGVLSMAGLALKRVVEARRHRARRPGQGFSMLELQ